MDGIAPIVSQTFSLALASAFMESLQRGGPIHILLRTDAKLGSIRSVQSVPDSKIPQCAVRATVDLLIKNEISICHLIDDMGFLVGVRHGRLDRRPPRLVLSLSRHRIGPPSTLSWSSFNYTLPSP
jgi:hypothetical protein